MSYLRKWNKFFFERGLSLFDILGLSIIGKLAEDSAWYLLFILPLIICSVSLEKICVKDQDENSNV